MYKATHDDPRYHRELEAIVRIDADAGAERTGRTRTLAARSALVLAEQLFGHFVAVRLRQPFESSLEEKQLRMDATIEAMDRLVDYEIADVTAAATYYMAETYFDFSRALIESERPAGLGPAELAEFELVLDEEAFPFEERAIDVHEKNIELLQAGVFNEWTGKSLGRLTELMPGRYAKDEVSAGFIGAIDTYVYRSPAAQAFEPAPEDAEPMPDDATHPVPVAVNDGGIDHASPR
jgi:cellulose synthase operon protein C